MTQEFTLVFHRALPSTAALLTRALRFNYWPVSALKPHQLSRTGNCLSPCKGGNWTPGLWRKVHIHCSSVHLIMWWIVGRLHHGELEAFASSTGRRFNRKVSEAGWSRSACIHWGNKQGILAGLTGNKWTQETLNHSYFLVRRSHFIPPTVSSRRLVVRQAEVVQLLLLSLVYPQNNNPLTAWIFVTANFWQLTHSENATITFSWKLSR